MTNFYIELLEDFREIAKSNATATYSEDAKVVAPGWMKAAVRRGRKIRESQPKSNQCCTLVGLKRANQIASGDNLSLSTIKRMKSFVARHSAQADWAATRGKQAQAIMLWGSPFSEKGVKRFISWCDAQINKLEN